MAQLSADSDSRELVVSALDGEYQRLLELGRAVRWTSGSYRYFLRHALADLALVADTGGQDVGSCVSTSPTAGGESRGKR